MVKAITWRRALKSLVPITCVTLFSALIIFTLFSKPPPLGRLQKIGWQSWDIVSFKKPNGTTSLPSSPSGGLHNETEWWDVPGDAGNSPISSLPLDVWAPLLSHHTGLTELTVKPCLLPPAYVDYCTPRSTPEEDALKGKWVRVERDLNWKTGIWYLNVWYRRSRRLDVPLITSLLILSDDEVDLIPEPKSVWNKASGSLTDGVYPTQSNLYLWYKLRPPLQDATDDEEIQEVITEIDVLFGEGRPWYGFEKMDREVTHGKHGKDSVWLTYRRGVKLPPKPKPLHFSHNGTFKIMQVADLHYSVSQGRCRDTTLDPCVGDDNTDSLLARALDAEKPDLVVFTGDQLNGQGTSWDSKSVIAKFAGMVIDRNISWAAVFGNHDDEQDLSRQAEMQLLQSMPFSLASAGPSDVDGVSNYVLKVLSADPSKTQLLTLYFLDSHAYSTKGYTFWKPSGYDWIKPSQRDWFLQQSNSISPIERPFTPDGASDLGHVWRADTRQNIQTTLAKPNALMFFHIPLPEAYATPDVDLSTSSPLENGNQLEGPGSSKHNGNFFEDAVLMAKESEAGGRELKVIANGHCHITDKCRRIKGVWMCFGGGGSYSGYGKIGFDRRFRVYEVRDFGETIETYKRTEKGEIVDKSILVGKGGPTPYVDT